MKLLFRYALLAVLLATISLTYFQLIDRQLVLVVLVFNAFFLLQKPISFGQLLLVINITIISLYIFKEVRSPKKEQPFEPSIELIKPRGYEYSIYFFEANTSRTEFSTKQLCAIESAARSNPNALIQIGTFRAGLTEKSKFILSAYTNIRIFNIEMAEALNHTSLLDWWETGVVMKSKYAYSHITDVLRFVYMWKYGGIYSDLDTITLKSFEPLLKSGKSGFGYLYEGFDSIGVGVLVFSKARHPYLKFVIDRLAENYNPNDWNKNGPMLAKDSIRLFCKVDSFGRLDFYKFKKIDLQGKTDSKHRCADLTVFPEDYFYPITYARNENVDIYRVNSSRNFKLELSDTYSFHHYGHASQGMVARIRDNCFLTHLAAQNCPFTFRSIEKYNLDFD